MKKYILPIALIILSTIGVSYGQQKSVIAKDYSVKRVGQKVEVRMVLSNLKKGRNSFKTIAQPIITNGQQSVDMTDVVWRTTKGRILDFRHNIVYQQGTIFAKTGQTVENIYEFPYKSWMNKSEFRINIKKEGCTKKLASPILVEQQIDLPPDTAYIIRPQFAYQQPAVERKARTEKGSAFLEFKVGSATILGDFKNNAFELAKINNSVLVVSKDGKNKVLEGIDIWGTCSPEGSAITNSQLAESRAIAVRNYIINNFSYSTSLFNITSTPENWLGLSELLKNNYSSWSQEIIKIAKSAIADDAKDKMVRSLEKGAIYKILLSDYYPQLRRVDYSVNYSIRDFTPQEVAAIYQIRPQDLSAAELFTLSQNYSSRSSEFVQIIHTSAALYPQNSVTQINVATSFLENGNLLTAEQYLNLVKEESPYYYNTLGVLQMLKGDYTQAYDNLKRAQDMGLNQASENIRQLAVKLKNIELLKSQQ